MFREIGVATEHCDFCGTYGTVAVLRTTDGVDDSRVAGCETCWRATGNAANLLRLVRLGKAPKAKLVPKKARRHTPGHPSAIAPPSSPVEHEDGPLSTAGADRSS